MHFLEIKNQYTLLLNQEFNNVLIYRIKKLIRTVIFSEKPIAVFVKYTL